MKLKFHSYQLALAAARDIARLNGLKTAIKICPALPDGSREIIVPDGCNILGDDLAKPTKPEKPKAPVSVATLEHKEKRSVRDYPEENPCIDCGEGIPPARLNGIPHVKRCLPCARKHEAVFKRRSIDEPLGSRQDFKHMYGRQGGRNRRPD